MSWRTVFVLSVSLLGCASKLSVAVQHFETGRPAEADAAFRNIEHTLPCDPETRARYALYRGLNHLTLGSAHEADRWLSAAKRANDEHSAIFSDEERGRLLAAWRSLGHMPGDHDPNFSARGDRLSDN